MYFYLMRLNLWDLFSECILHWEYILGLPFVAILFYLFLGYAIARKAGGRIYLVLFLLLTLVASSIMFKSLTSYSKIIAPLLLLLVMVIPLVMIAMNLYRRTYSDIRIWCMTTISGWVHSISWGVLMFVAGGS